MRFEPAPPNDFLAFVREYHAGCASRVPAIRAVAGKWALEDLIPGLSDFDARFVFEDGMRADDWGRASLEIGAVHAALCRESPRWARNLEHLPGVNVTVGELCEPLLYSPEFQQWTFYGGDAAVVARVEAAVAGRAWSAWDELHQLRRFAAFCGPYQRGIDPALNLGPWENKYPLHSRCMHYFAPAVQAAVSLALRRNVRGKLEALRLAREVLPRPDVIDRVLGLIASHYEAGEAYADPALAALEAELEAYLAEAWAALAGRVTLVVSAREGHDAARAKVAAVPVDPAVAFFENARFARLLKGRLLFYAETIPRFDSAWLITNELARAAALFFTRPLTAYAQLRFGEPLAPEATLDRLTGELVTAADRDAVLAFVATASEPIAPGREREQARRVAAHHDAVLRMIEVVSADLLQRLKSQ